MKGNRRDTIAKRLNGLYLPNYYKLCSELSDEWQPYCGLRTFEQQDEIYKKGRDDNGVINKPYLVVTQSKPGESAHQYGCASDWTIFDENDHPVWITKQDRRWEEFANACAKSDLQWGGFFNNFTDFYHNELKLKVSWHDVKTVYDKSGMEACNSFIQSNL